MIIIQHDNKDSTLLSYTHTQELIMSYTLVEYILYYNFSNI